MWITSLFLGKTPLDSKEKTRNYSWFTRLNKSSPINSEVIHSWAGFFHQPQQITVHFSPRSIATTVFLYYLNFNTNRKGTT